MFKAKTIYKKSGQIHQTHTHDQWRSAARVSMSKCTNPCYMTHRVLKARMNYCINQNPGQKITSKPNTEAPQCHWLPATRFQRVQNPDPNKLHNASKSCSKPKPSTKRVVKFTKRTHMINGVLLLGFQCPNAQTLATWLTACLKHGWIIVSIKTQAKK